MSRVSEFADKFGKIVYLTKEGWSHINTEHPEVAPYIKQIANLLVSPTRTVVNTYDVKVTYYYNYIKERKSYLLTIVKYLNGEGFIVTSYFIRKIL